MKTLSEKIYDVCIIGGGAAGLMAAGFSAFNGAETILVEKNKSLGKKLLITGSGRCNITNSEIDTKKIIDKFGRNGRFLYQALNTFGTAETLQFFKKLGVDTVEEKNGKLFPKNGDASTVLNALKDFFQDNGGTILSGETAKSFETDGNRIVSLTLISRKIKAKNYILATGGLSYAVTGSTGEGHKLAEALGHIITPMYPVLTPARLKEGWISELEGLSIRDSRITAYKENKSIVQEEGDIVFTKDGISGPAVYGLSKKLAGEEHLDITLKIDMISEYSEDKLDKKLNDAFNANPKKHVKTVLDEFIAPRILPILMKTADIVPETHCAQISKKARRNIIRSIKEFPVTLHSFYGFKRATITAGGVSLKNIDPKTMKSKIIENLYFAGEIIDLDASTGGYNLQLCWSTGHIAGVSSAKS